MSPHVGGDGDGMRFAGRGWPAGHRARGGATRTADLQSAQLGPSAVAAARRPLLRPCATPGGAGQRDSRECAPSISQSCSLMCPPWSCWPSRRPASECTSCDPCSGLGSPYGAPQAGWRVRGIATGDVFLWRGTWPKVERRFLMLRRAASGARWHGCPGMCECANGPRAAGRRGPRFTGWAIAGRGILPHRPPGSGARFHLLLVGRQGLLPGRRSRRRM